MGNWGQVQGNNQQKYILPDNVMQLKASAEKRLQELEKLGGYNMPGYDRLIKEARKSLEGFKQTMPGEVWLTGKVGEASYQHLSRFMAVQLMLDNVQKGMSQFDTRYYEKVRTMSENQFQLEISRINQLTGQNPHFYNAIRGGGNNDSVTWTKVLLDTPKNYTDAFNNRLAPNELQGIYGFNYNYFKGKFNQIAPKRLNEIENFAKANPKFANLSNGVKGNYSNLYTMNSCFNNDMKASGKTVKELSHMIARQQIMNLIKAEANQPKKPFTDKISAYNTKEFDSLVEMFAAGVEASPGFVDGITGKDAVRNEANLLSILEYPEYNADRLMKQGYFRQLVGSVMQQRTPGKTTKELNDVTKQVKINAIAEKANKKAEDFERRQLDNGGYDLGKQGYDYTKDEMFRIGTQLSQKYLSQSGTLFNNLDDPKNHVSKDLRALKASLQTASTAFIQYSKNRELQASKRKLTNKEDAAQLAVAEQELSKLVSCCEKVMVTDIGDNPEFQELYSNVLDATARVQAIKSGGLSVPQNDVEFEKGKKIHRIKAQNPDASVILENMYGKGKVPSNAGTAWLADREPLFPHDPCPDDIAQGALGDCYFVASLMAVASKNPDKIREMMVYNEKDNTVTVKLYSMNNEPVYVTVENSVPIKTTVNEKGEVVSYTGNMLNQGARWVTILEKAYAASGIHIDENTYLYQKQVTDAGLNSVENGTHTPSLRDIAGGRGELALKSILGPDMYDLDKDINQVLQQNIHYIKKSPGPIFPAQYNQTEVQYYNWMKSMYDNGQPVTAAINRIVGSGGDQDANAIAGLPNGHQYAIIGFSQEGGTRYVHVKNPHSGVCRGYDVNGNPMLIDDPDAQGVSKLELKDFLNCFNQIAVTKYNDGPARKQAEEEFEKNRSLYEEAVGSIDYFIQDNTIGSRGNPDMPGYQRLREESKNVMAALKSEDHDPQKLNAAFQKYFKAANEYVRLQDQVDKLPSNMKTEASANKYMAAQMIKQMQAVYNANQQPGVTEPQLCDYDDLKKNVMNSPAKSSKMRESALKIINTKEAKERAAAQKKKDKIMSKIESFEKQYNKYVAKASKKNNYDKMVESISQFLYIESVKQDAPNMSAKMLENKLKPAVVKMAVDDSKYYVGKVLQDIPEEVIKEKLFNLKDPKEIVSNFKQLREQQRAVENRMKDMASDKQAKNTQIQVG